MNDVTIAVEVLREWPGSTERLQRLWWSKRSGWWDEHGRREVETEGPPDPLTAGEIDEYLRRWAVEFLRQPMDHMTGPELEVMYQLAERRMLAMPDDGEVDIREASGMAMVEHFIARLGKHKKSLTTRAQRLGIDE